MEYAYTVLNDREIERIHQASLRVLSDVGMQVYDDELCTTLSRHTLPVDYQQKLVRFPPESVKAALEAAPRSFSMYDHKGNEIPLQHGNTLPAV